MNCPACQAADCRRSRRRSVYDYMFGVVGVVPWRCQGCETRFHARALSYPHPLHARCGICGNLDLQRIAPDKVPGLASLLGRVLGLPAVRCAPCRHKFFSLRPVLPMARQERVAAKDVLTKY